MDRSRPDRCPGALRPWPAADGLLVRLRLPGGYLSGTSLVALLDVAERYGDGRVHLTSRGNLQLRGMPTAPVDPAGLGAGAGAERLPEEVVVALEATGLLPSRAHDLARNVLASPQTGLAGGRADLRPVVAALDAAICASPVLAGLPGRFLFVLDDGRGDLIERDADLGLVALDEHRAQLRVGDGWGPVVALADAPALLADLARRFLAVRGTGPQAAWHVRELPAVLVSSLTESLAGSLAGPAPPDPALPEPSPPTPYGRVPGGAHVPVPETGLARAAVAPLAAVPVLVVTPWRGVLIPVLSSEET